MGKKQNGKYYVQFFSVNKLFKKRKCSPGKTHHLIILNIHSLPKGIQFGRQEISEVAERRKHDVKAFLGGLFSLQEQVSHSDLVYTFFHPILRDQEEANIRQRKLKGKCNQWTRTIVNHLS